MPRFDLQNYVDVDTRITRYWEMHPKPEGSIQTEVIWVRDDGNAVAIRATVYLGDRILATGIAHEERGTNASAGANFSSWWENAETSAIGRALANMDMSLAKNRPSRQEMAKVQRYEEAAPAPRPTPRQMPQDAPPAPIAPEPLDAVQQSVVGDAWAMAETDTLGAVKALLLTLKPHATRGQWKTISAELAKIQRKHYQEVPA